MSDKHMSDKQLWVAGRWSDTWELLGIYDDRDKAIARCKQSTDFVGGALLNENLPEETVEWDVFYPLA